MGDWYGGREDAENEHLSHRVARGLGQLVGIETNDDHIRSLGVEKEGGRNFFTSLLYGPDRDLNASVSSLPASEIQNFHALYDRECRPGSYRRFEGEINNVMGNRQKENMFGGYDRNSDGAGVSVEHANNTGWAWKAFDFFKKNVNPNVRPGFWTDSPRNGSRVNAGEQVMRHESSKLLRAMSDMGMTAKEAYKVLGRVATRSRSDPSEGGGTHREARKGREVA